MKFSNSFVELGDNFFERTKPTPVTNPDIFLWNRELAEALSVPQPVTDNVSELARIFAGNQILAGSEPIALAYAGHQFGNFVPQLGDGRAHLLGEVIDKHGSRKDIQLKGSGPTTFSRNGDGRCALGPAIREFIMGESMHALGVPTSRSLAVTTTGEQVFRESIQPGAVVTRVASSHLRVGTFEFFAARDNYQAVETLCDYAIDRHYPDLKQAGKQRFELLLARVLEQQVQLIVEWLRVGFIHGVMNTDNTSIAGETIDYGPCAMLGVYDPKTVFSSIDRQGRYAFGNQPTIAQWNMARFAETLLPLISSDEKQAVEIASRLINDFPEKFKSQYTQMLAHKLGLFQLQQQDTELISEFMDMLESNKLDYTISFNRLTESLSGKTGSAPQHFSSRWFESWLQRLQSQQQPLSESYAMMKKVNPIVIPRNHHMENVIQTCIETGQADAAEEFLTALKSPYSANHKTLQFQDAPADADVGYKTFCGT